MNNKIETRIKNIARYSIEDFSKNCIFISLDAEILEEWFYTDLILNEDIKDLSTIEISMLTFKFLHSLDLENIETIIKTIEDEDNKEKITSLKNKILSTIEKRLG